MSDFISAWAEPSHISNAYKLIFEQIPENRKPALTRANNRYNLYLNDKIHNLIIDYFDEDDFNIVASWYICLLYTSPSPRDQRGSRMPSSA